MKDKSISNRTIPGELTPITRSQIVYNYLLKHPDSSMQKIAEDFGCYRQVIESAKNTLLSRNLLKFRRCECGVTTFYSAVEMPFGDIVVKYKKTKKKK